MFNLLKDAIHWIETRTKFRPKTSLDYIDNALKMMHVNLDLIKKIHVTGTNGKGSVSMYLTHIFKFNGYKVGTFISPYLMRFNERIKINGQDIDDDSLLQLINKIFTFNEVYHEKTGQSLSFFELMTLMSIQMFSDEKVDLMIMEVGIGGLLDATNILNYDASVITNIGFDHMKQLGDTLEEISFNKLGIVKKHNHLFTTVDSKLHDYFKNYVDKKEATVKFIDETEIRIVNHYPNIIEYKGITYELGILGNYQALNAALAIEVSKFIDPSIQDDDILKGLKYTVYPGRLEEVLPEIFIDGAHNSHAIEALIKTLQQTFNRKRIHVLFSALADKEPKNMLDLLAPHVESIYVTGFDDPRYQSLHDLGYAFEADAYQALKTLIQTKNDGDIILITGSLHFIGYIKNDILPKLS